MSKLGINIRVKTILITTTALLMLLGLISWAVWDSFERKALQTESDNMLEEIDQVSVVLDHQSSELGAIALSHAMGDDLYALIKDGDTVGLSARFNDEQFNALRLNYVMVVDANGQVIFGRRYENEKSGLRGISSTMSAWMKAHAERFLSAGSDQPVSGLVNLEGETLLAAGFPILPADGKGPPAGALVLGRTLGDDFLGQVESEVGVTLAVQPVSTLSPAQQKIFERAIANGERLVIPLDDSTVQGAAVLSDLDEQPTLLLTVSQPRRVYREVVESRKALVGAMALIWAFVMAGAVLLLDRLVLHPMDQLNRDVAKIGAEGDFSMRLNRGGQDELTSLANAIDGLLNALEKTTQQQHKAEIELQNQLRSTLLLNRVIMAATAAKETKEILSTICMEMAQTFDIPQAAVALMNEHQTGLDVVAEYAADGRPLAEGIHISLADNEATVEAIRTKQPMIVLDAQNDPRVKGFHALARERGTVTLLIVPLVVRGKVVGTMGLDAIDQRKFTSEDVKLVQNVAGTVSQVLETTELYGELRHELEQQQQIDAVLKRRERILEATVRVQRDLLQADLREDVIPSILAALGESIEADHAIYYVNENRSDDKRIALRRGEWQADAGVRIQAPQQLAWEQFLLRYHLALENGELVNLAVQDLPASEQASWSALGVQQVLILPAVSEGVLTGFIIFTHNRPEDRWDSADMTQLQVAAASLALAVERWNAERTSEEVNHELEMQRDFALQVMTTMGQGLVVTASDGSFEFANPAFSRMIKKKQEQLIGNHLDDVVAPIDRFSVKKDSRLLKKGKIVHTELQLQRSDGTFMPVLLTGVPYWRDDRVTGTIAVITDLTEQRHTEDVLRKSETKYRSVVESVQEVIFQTGVTGRWAFLNPAWTEVTGQAVDESVGIAFYDFFYEPDRSQVLEQFERLIAMEIPECRFEARILSGDGGYRWVDFYARTNLDTKGQPIGISGTMTDITERKKAEYALRKSEESIRALYNITSNPQLNFSQKVQALLVMGAQHFGTPLGILARVENGEYVAQEVYSQDENLSRGMRYNLSQTYTQQVMDTGQPVVFEQAKGSEWEKHPCYQTYQLETYLGAPVVVDDHLYGALNFFSKEAHKEPYMTADLEFLRLMAQWVGSELEQEQYTIQLQAYAAEISDKNSALVEARDQAVEASRMKSEFLATMSHEIRTPMNAVIGMTEMLMDTHLNAAQADYAGTVRDSAQVLLALINDILDFSKIEAGKLELESIPLDVRKEVESAAGLFAARVHEKGLALMELVEPDIPAWLAGDPIRLRQVLFNLVGNAVKFTDQGEIRIRVEQIGSDSDAVMLRFTVADTGIGLSATARRRLFQPFTQADGSTTRKYGGTGLGLAISKSLVTLMKGE
ncbi:MAG: GAF domain-containing protein, partial [Anaerolineaceae bacterium]